MTATRRRARAWMLAGIGVLVVAVVVLIAIVALPILLHRDQGPSNQDPSTEEWPLVVTATGSDGRERSLQLFAAEPGGEVDTSALVPGERMVVAGSGYDPDRGIYVAICRIPDAPTDRPSPCLGGIPDTDEQESVPGEIAWAPSNWINDSWAWKLFGARPFDDAETGTFTAYLLVPEPRGEQLDCQVDACAIYTRNDHTASTDRVQDLGIPVAFAE